MKNYFVFNNSSKPEVKYLKLFVGVALAFVLIPIIFNILSFLIPIALIGYISYVVYHKSKVYLKNRSEKILKNDKVEAEIIIDNAIRTDNVIDVDYKDV
jgi:hypothetical protein